MLTERQREIILTAMRILTEGGTQNLTIRNVAAAIGVTEPAIYRHFANKHDLLTKLLEHLQEAILPSFALQPQLQSENLEGTMTTFIGTLFTHIEANPAYALFVFTEEAFHTDAQLRPQLAGMLERMLARVAKLVVNLQQVGLFRRDLEPQDMASMIVALIRLTITQWHLAQCTTPLTASATPLAHTIATLCGCSP